jgi:hypothetical protein
MSILMFLPRNFNVCDDHLMLYDGTFSKPQFSISVFE